MTTSIEEALRSGAVRLVPVEAIAPFVKAAEELPDHRVLSEAHPEWERCMRRFSIALGALTVRNFRNLTASPDHTPALVALIEERDRRIAELTLAAEANKQFAKEMQEAKDEALREQRAAETERDRLKVERDIANDAREAHAACTASLIAAAEGQLDAVEKAMGLDAVRFMDPPDGGDPTLAEMVGNMRQQIDAAEARALTAEAKCDALRALICRIEPHIDAIVCYASTMGENEPNRIAHEVRAVCYGPSQDELVGQQIAARMIAKIDAATKKTGVERAWLIELKGTSPSWAIVNPNDYDEHWTTDSTRALRFARKVDAEAYIAHIGWTEAFASEHIWDDGRGDHHAL